MTTLLFCVGATKAGTSWLHRFLSDHPQCHLRAIKELHYFDALDFGGAEGQLKRLARERERFEGQMPTAQGPRVLNLARQVADRLEWASVIARGREDRSAYLAYLTGGQGAGQQLVADMTPAYGLLSTERLKAMAGLLPDVRFVYLLRDPVERLWSHVRMLAGRNSPDGAADAETAADLLDGTIAGREEGIAKRSDYRAAIEKLRRAVDPKRLCIMFYEEMVSGDGMRRLCAFLGLDFVAPDTARRIHVSPPLQMTPAQRRAARDWLAPQYDYVRAEIGALPPAWRTEYQKV
ncbi:MAG: sulfotransferase [Rhodobacteraceae bacterium]|nr:sulfotransferase [Paracoccaceae bacterium]